MTLINKWFGGISGDEYFGTQGQHFNNENVDIYSSLKYVSLEKKKEVNSVSPSLNGTDFYRVIKHGKTSFNSYITLVAVTGGVHTGNLRIWNGQSSPTGTSYINYFPNGYVPVDYVDDGTNMHYFTVNGDALYYNTKTIDTTQTQPTYISNTNTLVKDLTSLAGFSGMRSVFATLTTSGKIYFAYGPFLFYAQSGVFLQVNEKAYKSFICGITEHSENIYIYLEDGTMMVMGVADNAIKGSKNMSDNIITAYSLGDIDVVFGEKYSYENAGLGVSSQKKLGYKMSVCSFSGIRSYHGSFDWDGERLSFIQQGDGDYASIGVYGNKKDGIGRGYSIIKPEIVPYTGSVVNGFNTSFSTKDSSFEINSINGGFLSFSREISDGTYTARCWYIAGKTLSSSSSGFIETLKDDGGQISKIKTLENGIRLGAKIETGASINVYYSLNGSPYELYSTFTSSGGVETYEYKEYKPIGNFNVIQWKIVLNSSFSGDAYLFDFDYKLKQVG